ncbi:carbohydrate sulfotransferase 8-like isoform X2 [Narcine bancroftii]|uniref:carbohydrate sulfotransferase 8-like isoform X2 n=1 Tax=Narcine bancroftii TaxID=1343680 RepID=UPI003831C05A
MARCVWKAFTDEPEVQVDPGEMQVTCDQGPCTLNTSTRPIVTYVSKPSPGHRLMDGLPRRQAPPPDTPRPEDQKWEAEPPALGQQRRRRRNALGGTRPRLRSQGMSQRGDPKSATRRWGAQNQEALQFGPCRLKAPEQEEVVPLASRRSRAQENPQSVRRRFGPRERRRLWAMQQERRQLVEEACLRYRGGDEVAPGPRPLAPHHVSRIYVEERHRLLYCEVPKAGCSNWKRVLMVLSGSARSPDQIGHRAAHYGNALRRLDSFDGAGVARRLRTYTKALFVREPLERLVSAFRDKLEQPNAYYQPLFGRAIIARYRPNATLQALRSGSGVTFPEFVRYLLDPRRPLGLDIHWEPVGRLCSPCLVRYDFIGRFESLGAEAEALLRLVGAPANLTFPTFKDRRQERTGPRLSRRYLAQLSAGDRRRLQNFYLADYTMFNYAPPFRRGSEIRGGPGLV